MNAMDLLIAGGARTWTAWGPTTPATPCLGVPAGNLNYQIQAWKTYPRAEGVYLQKLASTPGGTVVSTTPVSTAHRGVPRRAERSPTGGAYQGYTIVWRLPATFLGGKVPYPADLIVDCPQNLYAILSADYCNLTDDYRCPAVNLSLYLPDTVAVERPTYSQDQYGLDTPTWAPAYTGVNCRVQPASYDPLVEVDTAGQRQEYDVVLSQQLTLFPNDRVSWNGNSYTVQSYTNALRIGDLPSLRMRSSV